MKKVGLLVLAMLSFAQVSGTATDYSKMSANDLNEALITAVGKGSSDEVQKLVQAGADINQKITYTKRNYDDYDSDITCTLLEYAAKNGYVDIVKGLIQELMRKRSYVDMVKEFILQKPTHDDINKALIVAAEEGRVDVVRELVLAKPKVDAINTAFFSATRKGRFNVLTELIKAGVDVNYTDGYGNTALSEVIDYSYATLRHNTEAQKKNRAEVIQALLEAQANVNYANKKNVQFGETALMRAVYIHDLDVVQILLKAPGLNINYTDSHGNTALIIALQRVKTSYIAGSKEQYAACLNSQKILEILLKTPGINPHIANKNGDTAIKLLEKLKYPTVSNSLF